MNNEAALRLEQYLSDENAPFDINEITQIPQGAPSEQKFRIETKDQANWALRKIAGIEKNRAEARAAAQLEMGRIQEWLADEEKRADQARVYMDFLLEDYHRRIIAENKKAKTIKLLHGEIQLRAQQPKFTLEDKDVLDWAKKNRPEFVVQPPVPEPKLNWDGLKKVLKVQNGKAVDPATGEAVPGIAVIEPPAKFNVKLSGV